MTARAGGPGGRRVRVPAADELFRPTVVTADPAARAIEPVEPGPRVVEPGPRVVEPGPRVVEPVETPTDAPGPRTPSGRVRHDEKMTVYVTTDELLDIEHARLTLRRAGISVDRGRLVREAVAIALADLDAHGQDSALVDRLTQA